MAHYFECILMILQNLELNCTQYFLFLVKFLVPFTPSLLYSKQASLLFFHVFAEVAQVNAEALNIKSFQSQQKHYQESAKAKCIFI